MKEFYPWSTSVYNASKEKYINGRFSILDIQLGGECNFKCVYCDSPDRNKKSRISFSHLHKLIEQQRERYNWMFICGLGEPLCGANKGLLINLLELCKTNNIKCTIFTNGSNMDGKILDYVQSDILYPLIKIDTFSFELAQKLYGTSQANKNLQTIESLFEIAKNKKSNYCHIAASIVPTSLNINEIPYIVKNCIDNNVFPLLGQLEYAGNAIGSYNELLLSKKELLDLKQEISSIINSEYKVPICPSVISGIHINNEGYVSVDSRTGLSCSWFWLETPQTINLCAINSISKLSEAEKAIFDYRLKKSDDLSSLLSCIEEEPFGGCGGNIIDLFHDYIEIQNNLIQ